MTDRHMSSIFPECDKLKQIYDQCFTEFFQKFINSSERNEYAITPCGRLHEVYKKCVDERLETQKPFDIDLEEIRKNYLNTEHDGFKNKKEI